MPRSTPLSKKDAFELLLSVLNHFPDECVPPELIPQLEEVRTELRRANSTTAIFDDVNTSERHVRVFPRVAKHGCEPLVITILRHICSSMTDNKTQRVTIVDDLPMEATTFKMGSGGTHSYDGTIDHLLVRVRPGQFTDFWRTSPTMAFGSAPENDMPPKMPTTSIIIRAKKDALGDAVAQATITAASFCEQYNLSTLRGCITSGEQWMFFVWRRPHADGSGIPHLNGKFYQGTVISLGEDLENLLVIFGLLKDMVDNAFDHKMRFFQLRSD